MREVKKKARYEMWPEVSKKPWLPPIDTTIKGYRIGKKLFRLSYPVYADKAVPVMVRPGKGIEVAGTLFERKARPWTPKGCIIGWVPKRLKIAVFFERGRLWSPGRKDHGKPTSGWIAADVRGYHVAQGDDALAAIRSLLLTCAFTNEMANEERKKGMKVTRQMLHLQADVKRDMREMEKKAVKTGIILDGIEVPKDIRILEKQDRKLA